MNLRIRRVTNILYLIIIIIKHSKQDVFVKNTKATDNDRFQNGEGPRTYNWILLDISRNNLSQEMLTYIIWGKARIEII